MNVGKDVELIETRKNIEQYIDNKQQTAIGTSQAPSVDVCEN